MLIPIFSADGAFLVEVSVRAVPGVVNHRLEDHLVDCDAVNALFDAFNGFTVLTGSAPKRNVYIDAKSKKELEQRQCLIAGDSLGLAVLILLLQDATDFDIGAKKVCAATGALSVQKDKVVCREVGHLEAKIECLEDADVDVLYCPVQAEAPISKYKGLLVKRISAIKQDLKFPYFRMEFA